MLQQWARLIESAQKPILLSKRDGKLLRPVPSELRLSPDKLQLCLEAALEKIPLAAEARRLLCNAWSKGGWICAATQMRIFLCIHGSSGTD